MLASRLTEDPDCRVAVIEGGPVDIDGRSVLTLRNWISLLGGELDYDYPTTEQPRGNSHILHSRARVLGGCSSHNTLICFKPCPSDWDEWERAGADGLGRRRHGPRTSASCATTSCPWPRRTGTPSRRTSSTPRRTRSTSRAIDDFNDQPFHEGAGFFYLAYHPETNKRSSASVAYLHPHIEAGDRPNLTLLLETWAYQLELDGHARAPACTSARRTATEHLRTAGREVLVCAGAVDTPRLLMLSGIGPRRTWRRSASPSRTTCRAWARTCSTTPSR